MRTDELLGIKQLIGSTGGETEAAHKQHCVGEEGEPPSRLGQTLARILA